MSTLLDPTTIMLVFGIVTRFAENNFGKSEAHTEIMLG